MSQPCLLSSLRGTDNTSCLFSPQRQSTATQGPVCCCPPTPAQQRPPFPPPAATMQPKGISYSSLARGSPIWVVWGTHRGTYAPSDMCAYPRGPNQL